MNNHQSIKMMCFITLLALSGCADVAYDAMRGAALETCKEKTPNFEELKTCRERQQMSYEQYEKLRKNP